jgi:hypothetical protein
MNFQNAVTGFGARVPVNGACMMRGGTCRASSASRPQRPDWVVSFAFGAASEGPAKRPPGGRARSRGKPKDHAKAESQTRATCARQGDLR